MPKSPRPRRPSHQPIQRRHRPSTRAPHGSPEFDHRIGAWVTQRQFEAFHRYGGSAGLRALIDRILLEQQRSAAPEPAPKFSLLQLNKFKRYVAVQRSCVFNMLDPHAARKAGLSLDDMAYIRDHYEALENAMLP